MTKLKQFKLLMRATQIVIDSNICPKSSRRFSEWFRIIMYAHQKGWLYVGFVGDQIDLVAIAYRVPKVDSATGDELPQEESGNILYVPIVASLSKDRFKLTRMLRFYLKDNSDVNEIAYHYRNSEKLKHFILRSNHGKAVQA